MPIFLSNEGINFQTTSFLIFSELVEQGADQGAIITPRAELPISDRVSVRFPIFLGIVFMINMF